MEKDCKISFCCYLSFLYVKSNWGSSIKCLKHLKTQVSPVVCSLGPHQDFALNLLGVSRRPSPPPPPAASGAPRKTNTDVYIHSFNIVPFIAVDQIYGAGIIWWHLDIYHISLYRHDSSHWLEAVLFREKLTLNRNVRNLITTRKCPSIVYKGACSQVVVTLSPIFS